MIIKSVHHDLLEMNFKPQLGIDTKSLKVKFIQLYCITQIVVLTIKFLIHTLENEHSWFQQNTNSIH